MVKTTQPAAALPRRHGFTLIELTIVLALVALLLTIAVPRYFHSIENGKLSVQRQNLAAIRDALDKFYGDQGKYPDDLDDLVKKKYLRSIPVDPVTQLPNWAVVAPDDGMLGRVYDVRSAVQPDGPADAQVRDAARPDSAADAKAAGAAPRQPVPGNNDGR